MARDFIRITTNDTNAKFAGDLVQLVDLVRRTLNQVEKVRGIMDRNNDGSNYADVETLFGIPTGQGATVKGLVDGTRSAVRAAATLEIIDRCG